MDTLSHFGVKGMRWGVRKQPKPTFEIKQVGETKTITLKNGDKLVMSQDSVPGIARLAARVSPAVKKKIEGGANFTLKDKSGQTVGSAQVYKDSPTSLNLLWIDVKPSARGRGYAQAAVKASIGFAKKEKLEKVTLEVPGISPDARHIYDKLGFKETGKLESAVWGGLTQMELKLKHSAETLDEVLSHFGIKGMRWGVRRTNEQIDASADHTAATVAKQKIKKGGTKVLSNKELQTLVTRMNLEQQLGRLKENEPSRFKKGKSFVQTVLGLAKTAQEIHSVVNSPIGKEVRKLVSK